MWYLLYLLSLYFSPRVDEDTGDGDDAGSDDTGDGDDAGSDDTPAPRMSRAQKTIIETRARAQKAETDLAAANAALAEARRVQTGPAQKTEEQALWEQEEEVLRNPNADQWQKYAVQSTRAARTANATSQAALQRAEDLADKTAFAALATTKPKLYAAYKDRVEETLADARKNGANPSRENVLSFMLGQDMLSGKVKAAESKTAKPSVTPRAGVRSDVTANGGGRLSESEKRARRLENVRI